MLKLKSRGYAICFHVRRSCLRQKKKEKSLNLSNIFITFASHKKRKKNG